MSKNEINFLNRHISEPIEGRKVSGYHMVYWANVTTREIYAHSESEEIAGSISGYKVADIIEAPDGTWKIA